MKLHVKKDGTLYMKRPVPGIGWTTWQITQEGVDLLARKRVDVGDEIPEKVFEELLRRNYLYTGGSGPASDVRLAPGPEQITRVSRGSSKSRQGASSPASKTKDDTAAPQQSTFTSCLTLIVIVLVLRMIGK